MSKKMSNRGITLIALIITIIVLLILAVVSIRLVMNSGIINKAEKAVTIYSVEETGEQIKLAYTDYQMGKLNNKSYTFEQALINGGVSYTSVTGNDEEGYIVSVETKDGQKQFSVSANGIEKLKELTDYGVKIGDYVNYNPTIDKNNSSISKTWGAYSNSNTTNGWRVLGTD